MHVPELRRMGAKIITKNNVATYTQVLQIYQVLKLWQPILEHL